MVTNEGQFPGCTGRDNDLLSTGPMCRYVDDLRPMLKILAGTSISKLKLDVKVLTCLINLIKK